MSSKKYLPLKLALTTVLVLAAGESHADSYASAERREAATGHYSRARSLLVEALREFEAGRKIARPDMLLDSEEWRISIVSRTEELNRVLDPKPRVSKSGVYFSANPMLLRKDRERPPAPVDEAKQSNTYADQDFQQSKASMTRARMQASASAKKPAVPLAPIAPVEEVIEDAPVIPEIDQPVSKSDLSIPTPSVDSTELRNEVDSQVENRIRERALFDDKASTESDDKGIGDVVGKSAEQAPKTSGVDDSDEAIAAAIEEAIKARMNKHSGAGQ